TAHKHIVLIGDASFHESTDTYKNVERLSVPAVLAMAQPTGANAVWQKVQIHALRIVSPYTADHRRHREQFEQLAAGRDFPGLYFEYAGEKDAPKFIEQLSAKLRKLAEMTGKV